MNEILIYDFIGSNFFEEGVTAKSVHDALKDMDGDVTVRINSPGGDVFQGASIYNLLNQYDRGEVHTVIDGLAASAASVIAMAGKTTIAKNGLFMIHNPWTFAMGEAKDMTKTAELLDKVKDSIITTYESKATTDRDAISQLMDDETWFDAEGAVANGFVDEVEGEAESIAACAVPWIQNQPERVEDGGNVIVNVSAITCEIQASQSPANHARRIELRKRFSQLA